MELYIWYVPSEELLQFRPTADVGFNIICWQDAGVYRPKHTHTDDFTIQWPILDQIEKLHLSHKYIFFANLSVCVSDTLRWTSALVVFDADCMGIFCVDSSIELVSRCRSVQLLSLQHAQHFPWQRCEEDYLSGSYVAYTISPSYRTYYGRVKITHFDERLLQDSFLSGLLLAARFISYRSLALLHILLYTMYW